MIVDTMMRLKPVADNTSVTVHFRRVGQFLGLRTSWWPEKATRKGSSSLSGIGTSGLGRMASYMSGMGVVVIASSGGDIERNREKGGVGVWCVGKRGFLSDDLI